jgi:hypothetical protein
MRAVAPIGVTVLIVGPAIRSAVARRATVGVRAVTVRA